MKPEKVQSKAMGYGYFSPNRTGALATGVQPREFMWHLLALVGLSDGQQKPNKVTASVSTRR